MSDPVHIKVIYWGNAPTVEVKGLSPDQFQIEFCDDREEAQLKIEHGGVKVYHTEKDCCLSECWFATFAGCYHESNDAFDVRDLDDIPEALVSKYEALYPDDRDKQVMAYNIDVGIIDEDGVKSHG